MRIGVMADAHGNLPALGAALDDMADRGVDRVLHLGDAIGIGPQPRETVERLLADDRVTCVMGNHEEWFVHGVPEPRPASMSDAEAEHHAWVRAQLDEDLRRMLATWPWEVRVSEGGVTLYGAHYALRPARGGGRPAFAPVVRDPSRDELDRLFGRERATLVCFGHDHQPLDVHGARRYVNPGALGCAPSAIARWVLVDMDGASCRVSRRAAAYDDAALLAAFEARRVPARRFIRRVFYGGR